MKTALCIVTTYWMLHVKYIFLWTFFAAQLPRHFVLKPNKSIDVLQRQSGEVTCEAEDPSVSTLKWEKQQNDKSYAAVPNSQVNITKDSNHVRATLKIANDKFADAGIYKCTVSVSPNKSDYRLATVRVKGRFILNSYITLAFQQILIFMILAPPLVSSILIFKDNLNARRKSQIGGGGGFWTYL